MPPSPLTDEPDGSALRRRSACVRFVHAVTAIVIASGSPCFAAAAGPQDSQGPTDPVESGTTVDRPSPETRSASLVLRFTPYAWLTSFNGDFGARSIELNVDASFADILDESDSVIGFMGAIDAEVDRFVFQLNGVYTKAEFGTTRGRAGPRGSSVSAEADAVLETTWIEALAGYRLADQRFGTESTYRLTLDGFAGLRYTDLALDQSVTAEANVELPRGGMLEAGVRREFSDSQAWFEPFVGLRAGFEFGEGWSVSLRGDLGGFGFDGSDFSWQAIATLGYRWRFEQWSLGLFAGYRALGQDYRDDDFKWDMVTHGPLIGLSVAFEF